MPSGGEHLGAALGFFRFGPGPGPWNSTVTHFHEVLVGVPDQPATTGGTGRVRVLTIDKSTGGIDHPSRHPTNELQGPTANAQEFGHAVVGADVRAQYPSPGQLRALGHEVLVGAPGSEANAGAVYVYETRIDTSKLVGPRITEPTDTGPFVAVGAPDGQEVHLFSVSFFSPSNLVFDSTITPADVGLGPTPGFGSTLLVDDLDGDGEPELVIGAAASGTTIVLKGSSTGPMLTNPTVVSAAGLLGPSDELGASLAAGQLFDPENDARTVAIGAPGSIGGSGGVCLQRFLPNLTPRPLTCAPTPLLDTGTERFGAAVAIDNFNPFDPWMRPDSDHSLLQELAVSAPSSSGVAWTESGGTFTPVATGAAASGAVTIFTTTQSAGPVLSTQTPSTYLPGERPIADLVLRPVYTAGGTGFGTRLLAADLQETGRIDLIAGAPGHLGDQGAVQLLNSQTERAKPSRASSGATMSSTTSGSCMDWSSSQVATAAPSWISSSAEVRGRLPTPTSPAP